MIMGLYEPKSCCICFDRKNGSLILASLSLIGAILSCLSVVFGLLSFFLRGSLEPYVQNQELDPEDRENLVMDVCIAVLAFYTFVGVCSSLLIHGIRKDRPGLMLPYLVFKRFCIIVEIIIIFMGIALTPYLLDPNEFIYNILLPLTMVATIDIYFHLVINAYHKQEKPFCGWKHLLQGIQQWRH